MKSFCIAILILLAHALPAAATQRHGGPEGLYIHQGGHLFFAVAMGMLAFRLKRKGLSGQPGWRELRRAAFCFIAWNLDTVLVHLIDDQMEWVHVQATDFSTYVLTTSAAFPESLAIIYYFAKLDHLFLVPAMVFLCLGLQRLLSASSAPEVLS